MNKYRRILLKLGGESLAEPGGFGIDLERADVMATKIKHLHDQETEVVMYKTSKDGEVRQELFRRVFTRYETREINLYGLGGTDRFVVRGEAKRAIRINALGGPGPDRFVDESHAPETHFYDTEHPGNSWQAGSRTNVHRSQDPWDNRYPGGYSYERIVPWGYFWACLSVC